MGITEPPFVHGRLPSEIVASVFANRQLYLVLANYGNKDVTIETTHSFAAVHEADETGTRWTLKSRSLLILKKGNDMDVRMPAQSGTTVR